MTSIFIWHDVTASAGRVLKRNKNKKSIPAHENKHAELGSPEAVVPVAPAVLRLGNRGGHRRHDCAALTGKGNGYGKECRRTFCDGKKRVRV